ncbi:hypothetical protein [Fulvimarina endophytica]|uniref:hypothetical protein n=1 Tax=Fulvimarina endophytica TaxID=2293836 RepID=UPI0011C05689|nr:hypothetical protein [Fulvimarina endophytica]
MRVGAWRCPSEKALGALWKQLGIDGEDVVFARIDGENRPLSDEGFVGAAFLDHLDVVFEIGAILERDEGVRIVEVKRDPFGLAVDVGVRLGRQLSGDDRVDLDGMGTVAV